MTRLALALCFPLVAAACGGEDRGGTPVDANGSGMHVDASDNNQEDAPTTGGNASVLEYSHSLCGHIDGYRSRLLGTPGEWDPGRAFAVGLPSPSANFAVETIEYSVQLNAGGSAPIGLAHTTWLYTGDATGPKGSPLGMYSVPAGSNAGDHRIVTIATGETKPVITAGTRPYVVIDVTPSGNNGNSLDIDQCHTSNDPTGAYLFYAPENAPPFSSWLYQEPYFTSSVPDVRLKGTM